jgi:hypothetical protein
VEINTYALAVVAVLALAGCLALGIGLAIHGRSRSGERSGHTPGGLVLPPPGSGGLWGEHDARAGAPSNTFQADERAVEGRRRRRPLTADQQATRDAWARWRSERGNQTRARDD